MGGKGGGGRGVLGWGVGVGGSLNSLSSSNVKKNGCGASKCYLLARSPKIEFQPAKSILYGKLNVK